MPMPGSLVEYDDVRVEVVLARFDDRDSAIGQMR